MGATVAKGITATTPDTVSGSFTFQTNKCSDFAAPQGKTDMAAKLKLRTTSTLHIWINSVTCARRLSTAERQLSTQTASVKFTALPTSGKTTADVNTELGQVTATQIEADMKAAVTGATATGVSTITSSIVKVTTTTTTAKPASTAASLSGLTFLLLGLVA